VEHREGVALKNKYNLLSFIETNYDDQSSKEKLFALLNQKTEKQSSLQT